MDSFDKAHILSGRTLIKGVGIPDLIDDPPLWKKVWSQSRDELLSEWLGQKPGTRPICWWIFDHGKERPVLHPMAPAAEAVVRKQQTYLGILHTSIFHSSEMVPFQEEESEYLERMGLLTPAERAALEADDETDDDD
jgi:hypothetical protein